MGDIDNVEELKIKILNDLGDQQFPHFQSQTCICRVPSSIRDVNVAAYTPKVISIGPLHHGNDKLKKMEAQKKFYLKSFCERVKRGKQVVDDLLRIIEKWEDHIRGCYEERLECSNTEFMEMLLLDSVFIMEFFLRRHSGSGCVDDFMLRQPSIAWATFLDLGLLENQIPYFLLKRLYDETFKPKSNDKFDRLVWHVLFDPKKEINSSLFEGVKHFVDLKRNSFLKGTTINSNPATDSRLKLKYSATKLQEAGVKFLPMNRAENWKFDVKFQKRVFKKNALRIPVLEVRDYSEQEFRNLMAFEQFYYPREAYICNFFFLLDYLINTGEDVDILADAGIVIHWHGSNQLFAKFINTLCHGMSDYATCYASMYEELNQHYETRVNHWMPTLVLVYFNNLWRGTGTVAAIFLLLLTLAQTIYTILSYYQ